MHFKQRLPYTTIVLAVVFLCVQASVVYAGTLSCSITTAAACTGTVIYRMSGTSNAHTELAGQSTAAYASTVVCCSGITGLSNVCASPQATALNLTAVTNSHASQTATTPYTTPACISVPTGGTVSVGYQATNCTGFDTTLGSMSATTNAHVGNSAAYTTKICATASGVQTLTFSISDSSIGFGSLVASDDFFANGAGTGSATEVEAHTITASTNASSGYTMTVNGNTLTSGVLTINAIGSANTATVIGTEQFGLRMTATGGNGSVTVPYAAAGFAFDTATFPDQVASDADGDDIVTTYSARYLGNISAATEASSYSAVLTYTITASF